MKGLVMIRRAVNMTMLVSEDKHMVLSNEPGNTNRQSESEEYIVVDRNGSKPHEQIIESLREEVKILRRALELALPGYLEAACQENRN
ncbi:MAG: hypothetical protein ACYCW6_12410 [Candidatus Xenobia bacterium]